MEGLLGTTINGLKVYDRQNSHFHPEGGLTVELLTEALSRVWVKNRSYVQKFVVDFDRVIGKTTCVSVTDDDDVIMCRRKGRKGPTPMVKNREPEDSKQISMCLRSKKDGTVELITAYIGGEGPREPWDRTLKTNTERIEAIKFWQEHALIFDPELISREEGPRKWKYQL